MKHGGNGEKMGEAGDGGNEEKFEMGGGLGRRGGEWRKKEKRVDGKKEKR